MALKATKILWSCSCKARAFPSIRSASTWTTSGSSGQPVNALATFGFLSRQTLKVQNEVPSPLQATHFPLQSPVFNPTVSRLPMGIPINYRIIPVTDQIKPRNRPMEDPTTKVIIEESPETSKNRVEKRAARLVVIRRIKMNRHKLKKLRKRQKHEIAKKFLRRNIRKERIFLDARLAQIREAERFDPAEHVRTMIARAKEKPPPRFYKGKRLPTWWIKEQLALGKIKYEDCR